MSWDPLIYSLTEALDLGLASEVRGGGQSCGTDSVTCGIQVDSVKTELSVGHRVGGPELLGGGKNDQ